MLAVLRYLSTDESAEILLELRRMNKKICMLDGRGNDEQHVITSSCIIITSAFEPNFDEPDSKSRFER